MSDNNVNGADLNANKTTDFDLDANEITVDESVLPFAITYRRIYRRPQIEEIYHFVGVRRALMRAAAKVKEIAHEVCFELERKTIDPGSSAAVHWGVQIADPFDASGEQELVARCYGADKPAAAINFHVVSVVGEQPAERPVDTRPVEHSAYTPRNIQPLDPLNDRANLGADRIRKSMRDEHAA